MIYEAFTKQILLKELLGQRNLSNLGALLRPNASFHKAKKLDDVRLDVPLDD